MQFGGQLVAVMSDTVTTLDGKEKPYLEIPDDGTELVEVGVDLKRNVATKLAYVTVPKKDA